MYVFARDDQYGLFCLVFILMITLPNVWGLQEQATQKDGGIMYSDLLRGTHGLRLVLPHGLHCCRCTVLMLNCLCCDFLEENKFDLI